MIGTLTVKDLAERFAVLCSQGFGDCDVDVEAAVHVDLTALAENGHIHGDRAVFPHTLQDIYEIEPDARRAVVSIMARSHKPATGMKGR